VFKNVVSSNKNKIKKFDTFWWGIKSEKGALLFLAWQNSYRPWALDVLWSSFCVDVSVFFFMNTKRYNFTLNALFPL